MKDFITFIKKYSTRDFIYLLSRISIEIYKKQLNHDDDEMNCCMKFPLDIMEFEPLQNVTLSEACEDVKLQILQYIDMVR